MPETLEAQLANALRAIYRKLDLVRDELLQLSPKELMFLLILDEAGPCRVNDLAGRVRLPLSTVSWTADRMVSKGLLSRRTDPSDRRAILLSLARQGRKALGKHRAIFDHLAGVVVGKLEPGEAAQVVRIIRKAATFFD